MLFHQLKKRGFETTIIISNEEMNDKIKIVQGFERSYWYSIEMSYWNNSKSNKRTKMIIFEMIMLLGTLGPKVNVTRYFVRKRVNKKEMLRAGYI